LTNRYIDLNQYDADPRVIAWLEAHDINPSDVPSAQYAQVAGGRLIYQEFLKGTDGHKLPIHDGNGEACAWQKRTTSVPLLSAPENHGL
jgi:hypothetical protein